MEGLRLILDGDGAFADWLGDAKGGKIERVTTLPDGTARKKPSVAFGIVTDDGQKIIAETTWNLLYTACRGIEARYGPSTD